MLQEFLTEKGVMNILTEVNKRILMEFIVQGHREKENLVLSEENYNQLKELDLIIEEGSTIFINPKQVTILQDENEEDHYFVFKKFKKYILAEHLNDIKSNSIKLEVCCSEEIHSALEEHLEKKQKIENNMKNWFGF